MKSNKLIDTLDLENEVDIIGQMIEEKKKEKLMNEKIKQHLESMKRIEEVNSSR